MSLFSSRARATGSDALRRILHDEPTQSRGPELTQWLIGAGAILFAVIAAGLTSVGLTPAGLALREGEFARQQVVAELDFSFNSALRQRAIGEARAAQTPPIYRLTLEPWEAYVEWLWNVRDQVESLASTLSTLSLPEQETLMAAALAEIDPERRFRVAPLDLVTLLGVPPAVREEIFRTGLEQLKQIYLRGIVANEALGNELRPGTLALISIVRDQGAVVSARPFALDEVYDELRRILQLRASHGLPPLQERAFIRLLQAGIAANLAEDADETARRREEARATAPLVEVSRRKGDLLVEPGTRISAIDAELLRAYRNALSQQREGGWFAETAFLERLGQTALLTVGLLLLVRHGGRNLRAHRRELLLAGVVVLANLLLLRLVIEAAAAGLLGPPGPAVWAIVPFVSPFVLGTLLVGLLAGIVPGLITAVGLAAFCGLMHGQSVPIFLCCLFSAIAGLVTCRDILVRGRVVQAGLVAGLAMAVGAFLLGFRPGADWALVLWQMVAAIGTGAVTGVIVIGLLPVMENLFGLTTNITLLELTDTNHPLLRRMQEETPGTYHHSLMVATLAARAADAIGANSMMTRACAMYHDIGKLVKPEYFVENQPPGANLHTALEPSMSALIIRSHVTEGVVLARQYRLPTVVQDVIEQHHGTSLIRYFYHRARDRARETHSPLEAARSLDPVPVEESTYRYEGPKPRFKESALIFFADSIEAASRTLRKVNMQSINDLIDALVRERVEDDQLTECPLTFEELEKMKQSFAVTLLNMLHSRVEYPKREEAAKVADPRPVGSGATPSPVPAAARATS